MNLLSRTLTHLSISTPSLSLPHLGWANLQNVPSSSSKWNHQITGHSLNGYSDLGTFPQCGPLIEQFQSQSWDVQTWPSTRGFLFYFLGWRETILLTKRKKEKRKGYISSRRNLRWKKCFEPYKWHIYKISRPVAPGTNPRWLWLQQLHVCGISREVEIGGRGPATGSIITCDLNWYWYFRSWGEVILAVYKVGKHQVPPESRQRPWCFTLLVHGEGVGKAAL